MRICLINVTLAPLLTMIVPCYHIQWHIHRPLIFHFHHHTLRKEASGNEVMGTNKWPKEWRSNLCLLFQSWSNDRTAGSCIKILRYSWLVSLQRLLSHCIRSWSCSLPSNTRKEFSHRKSIARTSNHYHVPKTRSCLPRHTRDLYSVHRCNDKFYPRWWNQSCLYPARQNELFVKQQPDVVFWFHYAASLHLYARCRGQLWCCYIPSFD